MKKFKAKLSALAISLGLASMPLSAATTVVNVPVVHGAWTYIGVPGFQSYGATSGTTSITWPSTINTSSPLIIDGSGTTYKVAGLEVPTWDGNITSPKSTSTAASGAVDATGTAPRPAYSGAGVGSDVYGTVGVMVLGQVTTGALDSTTDHNGATIAAVAGWNEAVKDYQSPIRTLYVQSPNAAYPDIKVLYQARYEGETFLIQYETGSTTTALSSSDNITYTGTFSRAYTYDNAAVLGSDFPVFSSTTTGGTSGSDVSGILASFDMDLSDNNMSSSKNDIQPSTVTDSLRGVLDGNMTVLGWDAATQQWRQFRATGNGTSTTATTANDFSTFTQGQGYWVKVNRDGGASFNNPSGFVLGYDDAADINHSASIADGWNMLSFGDRFLSYSVTGMHLTAPAVATDLNITDTYGASTLTIALAVANSNATDCLNINKAIDSNNSYGFTNFALKCIPSNTGLTLLSTRSFTVQYVGVPQPLDNLAGTLTAESNGSATNFYRSQYGTHALIIEPNTYFTSVTGADGNMSVEFPADSQAGTVYTPVTTAAVTAPLLATSMDTASANLTARANEAIQLDMNYDSTVDAVLMTSNYRFFVKDATIVRVFSYDATRADTTNDNSGLNDNYDDDNNASIRIVGAAVTVGTEGDLVFPDDRLTRGAKYIDNLAFGAVGTRTEVNATRLGANADVNTTLMLYYTGLLATDTTRIAKIDLQEWGNSWDVFQEIDPSLDQNATSEGAIANVWHVSNIVNYTEDANGTGQYDGNYSFTGRAYTSDLRNNAVYAESFPVAGPLYDIVTGYGKRAELIITGQTEANSASSGTFISWKQIDASVPPAEWYDTDNQFELFWTEKEKGYWVYLNGASTNDLSFGTPVLQGTPYAHFNNVFTGAVGTTRNHMNHTLSITANNLTTVNVANSNTDSYEVYAQIGGYWTSFQRDNATNTFIIPIDSHETPGLSFDAGEVAVDITAAEGSGKKITTTYTLDYSKPVITSATVSGATATVSITNGTTAATDIDVYNGDINDSDYGVSTSTNWAGTATVAGDTTDVVLGAMNGLSFPTAFENNATAYLDGANWYENLAHQLREGLIKDVRFTAKDAGTLYSDQYRLYYIPVYSGTGILSDDGTDTVYDSNPLVYTTAGVQDTTTTTTEGKTYTGAVGGADDGVQLKSAVIGTTVSCVYAHTANVTLNESAANVKTLQTTTGSDFAIIMYMDEYIGQPFMCEVDGLIYVGGFVDADTYLQDITVQPLSTSVTATIVKQ